METKSYFSHEVLHSFDLYSFIRSKAFKNKLLQENPELYEFVNSFTCHPEIKNDWLMEGLIDNGYMSDVVTYYLKDQFQIPFFSYYPPKEKVLIKKEKEKFLAREYCMITVQVSITKEQWYILKLKDPTQYDYIKRRFMDDLGW